LIAKLIFIYPSFSSLFQPELYIAQPYFIGPPLFISLLTAFPKDINEDLTDTHLSSLKS